MRTLITILGTGDYLRVKYEQDGIESTPTSYIQCAITEILRKSDTPVERVCVLLTQKAREKHWESLADELRTYGCELVPHEIPDGANETELWEIFEKVGEATHGASSIVLDATHGFRSLQFITLLALNFFRNSAHFPIERVLYGAFETLGSAKEVKIRQEESGVIETAPIFDLTEMLLLPEWAEAAAEWSRSGSSRRLGELAKEESNRARRQMKGANEFTQLVDRIEELGQVLSLVRHADISERATAARSAAQRINSASDLTNPRLAPMRSIASLFQRSLEPIAVPQGDSEALDHDYLVSQLAIARYYSERVRMLEAFSILRELLVSLYVRIARPLTGQTDRERLSHYIPLAFERKPADENERPNPLFLEFFSKNQELRDTLADADDLIRDTRNGLDHCWIGKDDKWKGQLDRLKTKHSQACEKIEEAIGLIKDTVL